MNNDWGRGQLEHKGIEDFGQKRQVNGKMDRMWLGVWKVTSVSTSWRQVRHCRRLKWTKWRIRGRAR